MSQGSAASVEPMAAVQVLSGVVSAPLTPMAGDLEVDLLSLPALLDHQINAGISGVTACAMTAEAESLSIGEQESVLAAVVEAVAGRVPVYSGIGRPSILETRRLILFAERIGSDGLFVITPFSGAYTKSETMAYFRDVASRTALPIMIYNCPAYSRVNLSPQDHAALCETPNIVATKEGNQAQLHETVLATEGRMAVFTARDSYLLPSLAVGAAGVVSFVTNVAPTLLVELFRAVREGDLVRAQQLHAVLTPLTNALVARSYPTMIKAAVTQLGLPVGPPRRIETALTSGEIERIAMALKAVDGALANRPLEPNLSADSNAPLAGPVA